MPDRPPADEGADAGSQGGPLQAQDHVQPPEQPQATPDTVVTHSVAARFEGPVPPPHLLAAYNEAFPGCAERIVAMAESQGTHRQRIETAVVKAQVAAELRGQVFSFLLALTAIVTGGVLISYGRNVAGLIAILAAIGTPAGVFVYGKRQQAKKHPRK